ncbi:FAD/NAD(P)-binding protein [Ignisphaera sp. 4213-co]|uniref:FAD/NAD(P)-binding protein n=1 Tax=Ignisphaera cupida TaxID=3050454 RepID=A0ABD4ZAB5_9CREN|nr:FAD/NAD(P)-binding protein [Ignisphaera sp. 4213-co]MDK6029033.1 FAD/NAD(P)-binding protein [Ignisphaera sp. 4213-co]
MSNPFTSIIKGVVINEISETTTTKTITIKLVNGSMNPMPGQFNMLYVFGLGEVPISISNLYPGKRDIVEHTIRFVGAVTRAMIKAIRVGSQIGVRGPYGNKWPLEEAEGSDILIVSGGIGFAPLRPVVKYIIMNRERFRRVNILYGARTPEEFLYKYELEEYSKIPNSKFLLSIDKPYPGWTGYVGFVTDLIKYTDVDTGNSYTFVCGPEIMMKVAVKKLLERGFRKDKIFLSMERRMRCGVGICGTCQFGHLFVCKNGPIFRYSEIENYINVEGI